MEEVENLLKDPSVLRVRGDLCQYGMVLRDAYGEMPVLKPTGFMTNSEELATVLSKICPRTHEHMHLMSPGNSKGQTCKCK